MNTYFVLTSSNRKLNLPLDYFDLDKDEEIVSTDAPYGMLFVLNKKLYSYFMIEKENINDGALVCVPLIDDFKEQEKHRLLKELDKIDKV
jgi:hypothetical protein